MKTTDNKRITLGAFLEVYTDDVTIVDFEHLESDGINEYNEPKTYYKPYWEDAEVIGNEIPGLLSREIEEIYHDDGFLKVVLF